MMYRMGQHVMFRRGKAMKLRFALTSVMLAIILFLSSCLITSRDINVDISCEQFGMSNHIRNDFQVEIGDKIRVKLCSNPATGFKWGYEVSNKNILKEEDYDFEEPKGDVLGAAGIEVWTFEAVDRGRTKVHLEYSRPWEGGEKAEWTYTMTVTVE